MAYPTSSDLKCADGKSVRQQSHASGVSRKTISRWIYWIINEKFKPFAFRLKSKVPWLGRYHDAVSFWIAAFESYSLSNVMRLLNNLGEIIP